MISSFSFFVISDALQKVKKTCGGSSQGNLILQRNFLTAALALPFTIEQAQEKNGNLNADKLSLT